MSTVATPFAASLVATPTMDDASMSAKDDIPLLEDVFEPTVVSSPPTAEVIAPDAVLMAEISEAVTDRAQRLTTCLLEHHLQELQLKLNNEITERLTTELPDIIDTAVQRYIARHKR